MSEAYADHPFNTQTYPSWNIQPVTTHPSTVYRAQFEVLPKIKIKRSELAKKQPLPSRAYDGDACWDLYVSEDTEINTHTFVNVPTGISVEIPDGYWMEIRPRSSTSRERNILVLDAVIDQGYRGELFIQALLINGHDDSIHTIKAGDRIAQFRLSKIRNIEFEEVDELSPSERGIKALGSSGKNHVKSV